LPYTRIAMLMPA